MTGTIAQNVRSITLSTTVTMLFTEDKDKANGQIGMVNGLAISLTSLLSGITIGFLGMVAACIATVVVLMHLLYIKLPEAAIVHTNEYYFMG